MKIFLEISMEIFVEMFLKIFMEIFVEIFGLAELSGIWFYSVSIQNID